VGASRRHELGRPIVVTTNRPFTERGALFPNATCIVRLVDRRVQPLDRNVARATDDADDAAGYPHRVTPIGNAQPAELGTGNGVGG
jgi:hypothetical protein